MAELVRSGFPSDQATFFFVNPPGQHDLYPIGGDEDESPGTHYASTGAASGAVVGGTLGLAVGIASLPVLGPGAAVVHEKAEHAIRTTGREPAAMVPEVWPIATVQLPIYNELYVAGRLIRRRRTTADLIADLMRSLLSFTAASGRPTVRKTPFPADMSTSTSTTYASMP
jgi:hypothetical protein